MPGGVLRDFQADFISFFHACDFLPKSHALQACFRSNLSRTRSFHNTQSRLAPEGMKLFAFNKALQMRVLGFYARVTMPHVAYLYLYEVWRNRDCSQEPRHARLSVRFWRGGNIRILLSRSGLWRKRAWREVVTGRQSQPRAISARNRTH